MPKMHYTMKELDAFAIDDLMRDMQHALNQSESGPFYPDKGITKEYLRSYAEELRGKIEKYSSGGAHFAVLKGR
jgi:hypothetical protein